MEEKTEDSFQLHVNIMKSQCMQHLGQEIHSDTGKPAGLQHLGQEIHSDTGKPACPQHLGQEIHSDTGKPAGPQHLGQEIHSDTGKPAGPQHLGQEIHSDTGKPAGPQHLGQEIHSDTGKPAGLQQALEEEHLSSPGTKREKVTKVCDLCTFDNLQEPAIGFCINCTDFLCKRCLVNHSRIKVTRSHVVLQGDTMPANAEPFLGLRALVKCKLHPEYDIEFICAEHSTNVCAICITDKHHKCKLHKLCAPNTGDNPKQDAVVEESILNLESQIEQFASNRERYLKRMQEDRERIIKEAQENAKLLIEKIETHTKLLEDEITQLVNKETNITESNINDAKSMYTELRRIKDLHETSHKYGSAKECVLAACHVDATSKEIARKITLLETYDDTKYLIDIVEQLPRFSNICNISLTIGEKSSSEIENASDEVVEFPECNEINEHLFNQSVRDIGIQCEYFISKCNQEVQTVDRGSLSPPTVQKDELRAVHCTMFDEATPSITKPFIERLVGEKSSYYIGNNSDAYLSRITAIQIFSDGKILLADRSNKAIKLLSSDFEVIDEYTLSGSPLDVCLVDDDIYVCCSDEKQVSRFGINVDGELFKTGGYPTRLWPVSISHFDQKVIILFLTQEDSVDDVESESVTIEIRDGSRIDRGFYIDVDDSDDEDDDLYHIVDAKRILTLETGSVLLAENDRVSCYDIDAREEEIGGREWFYRSYGKNHLHNTRGLATDTEGNVYICGQDSNNVHQVSSMNYRQNRILIADINMPLSVCVDSERDRLIVGCDEDDYIHVFEFK
ncbi:uncharacterized protein LOC127867785 isoform X4 [Dreissena polymorpha]|uniref:uncharacterized protein LOC127867785 isoform X4 n=1 Tax=Dreissena polymorpha TaxID=45954 RepID=UPI00226517A2|nr:uncharacterized protein LOC127867785 isoform X4 [Dreissena polymorpha]